MNIRKLQAIVVFALIGFLQTVSVARATTVVATVNGMVCAFCAAGIEKKMRANEATQEVYVNLAKNIVAVQLKEGKKIDDAQFRSIITEAGYEVKQTKFVEQTAAQVKQELKAQK